MARNSEKAQSMLFRFRAQQASELGIVDLGRMRRPKAISSVDSVPICERWRGQVLKEISRKVSKIQEQSLTDYQIRDLNDEINKLMREKWHWEKQIRDLGGPNYMRSGGTVIDDQGREIPGGGGGKGYRYFGRARELPGVKEMFEAAAERARDEKEASKDGRQINEMARKHVDASYYGWNRDEEDGTLLAYEAKRESEAKEQFLNQAEDSDGSFEDIPGDTGDGIGWVLPTSQEVEEEFLNRRKQKLLDRLAS